jgi:hypothetical protein
LHAFRRNADKPLLVWQDKPVKVYGHLKDVSVAYALGEDAQGAKKARKDGSQPMPSGRVATVNYRVIDFDFVAHVITLFYWFI